MALLEVLKYPDPVLRRQSEEVESVTPELQKLADDMLETMYEIKGIGLSAVQVGHLHRLFVMDTRARDDGQDRYETESITELEKKAGGPIVIFNPVIVEKKGDTTYREGCLSLPSYFEVVDRFEWIRMEGLDRDGNKMELELDGLMSVCAQHELDHLDGKLFIDRLSLIKGNRIRRQIKKNGYPEKKEEELAEELVEVSSSSKSSSKPSSEKPHGEPL